MCFIHAVKALPVLYRTPRRCIPIQFKTYFMLMDQMVCWISIFYWQKALPAT